MITDRVNAFIWILTFLCSCTISLAGEPSLFSLIKSGNVAELQKAIEAGADVNAPKQCGITPIQFAVMNSASFAVIDLLIQKGADVKAPNGTSGNLLHLAAESAKDPEIIPALVKAGVDINARKSKDDGFDSTPLQTALLYSKYPEVIIAFIKAGANVNETGTVGNALHYAVWASGDKKKKKYGTYDDRAGVPMKIPDLVKIVKALLEAGVEVNTFNQMGFAPIHLCLWEPRVAQLLLENKADYTLREKAMNMTPLDYAKKYRFFATVTILKNAGAKK